MTSSNRQSARSSVAQMTEVKAFTTKELTDLKLIHSGMSDTNALKAFRDLRTRIMSLREGNNFSLLVVPIESGGGSHVAVNLAAAIALDRTKSSLLIDCNLYSPTIEQYLPGGSDLGLTDYLDDPEVNCEDIVYATGIPRMRAIPVGHNCDGGTEKLASVRMQSVMSEMKLRYDDRFIVVDGPAFSNYEAEVQILAELCDLVLLVVASGTTTESAVTAAAERIGSDKLAGVVFNER